MPDYENCELVSDMGYHIITIYYDLTYNIEDSMHTTKIKLLVTGRAMSIGGVAKALLALLNTIDYNKYDVDLLLMEPGGDYMPFIDKRVRLLSTPECFEWVSLPKHSVFRLLCRLFFHPLLLFFFLRNIFWGYLRHNMAQARQRMWRDVSPYIPTLEGKYDVVLDFSGLLRRYVLEKVEAKRKYTWIHSDYRVFGLDKEIDESLLSRYDKVFCVSDTCKTIFDQEFPSLACKSDVLLNTIDLNYIRSQIKGKGFDDNFTGIRLLDVTRIDPNKGLDIAVKVCSRLKQKGLNIRWYILGNDPLGYRKKLEKLIEEYNVVDTFILLGFTSNPYPYMDQADLIVHFSRFEGRSVAIDEALVLEKKILLTNYPTAKDQITHGVNGYICDFEENSLIEMIENLIHNKLEY